MVNLEHSRLGSTDLNLHYIYEFGITFTSLSEESLDASARKHRVAYKLRDELKRIPDFPKPGVNYFNLIRAVPKNPGFFGEVIEVLAQELRSQSIDHIAGLEACGLVFGAALSQHMKLPFTPIRKAGKTPPPTLSCDYSLEYGSDTLEINTFDFKRGERVALIDDVIATGGSASAAISLINSTGAKVVSANFLIELLEHCGREKLETPRVNALVQIDK